jgi:hypothetical protein
MTPADRIRVCAKCGTKVYFDNGMVTFACLCGESGWKWMDVLTPTEEEKYVRDRLDFVRVLHDGEIRLLEEMGPWFYNWHEAYLFTLGREKQIARCERGIGLLKEVLPGDMRHDAEETIIAGEILAREQAALAERKKGWKG